MNLKSVLFVSAFLVVTTSAFAQQVFNAHVDFIMTAGRITAEVKNIWYKPIRCVGKVYGGSDGGKNPVAEFDRVLIPGQIGYVYLNTPFTNPFLDYKTDIVCSYTY